MPGYSWKKAKTLLTETEKDRLCCLILTCADQIKPTTAEFAVAAKEFDAAAGGFTKMYQTTIKKLKDNNAFAGGEDAAADGDTEAPLTAVKPKPTPRKRKAKSPSGEADGETATPKKRVRMTKKAKAEAEAAAAQAAEGAANGGAEAIEEDTAMGAVKEEDGGI
ncbi:hypothetical protein BLS_004194 [Venturia inaequalis]|uniref:Uncharacterized protein n=1 Tax=Venturia inaequalis TaxID=5025 RepID=A0A8H3UVY6_VENIN|nr:hypothetical protein BLS_004194 [Venturia inaequalis]KAE9977654.1 hypothetical protein EG328_001869 [Venturia inaequalis]KAE9981779.1 hypothetical protein EG327_006095 [Venturia inaequalis]